MATYIEVMRVMTYLKIICSQPGVAKKGMLRFKDAIAKEALLEALIESYLMRNTSLKSATYTIEFLGFLST